MSHHLIVHLPGIYSAASVYLPFFSHKNTEMQSQRVWMWFKLCQQQWGKRSFNCVCLACWQSSVDFLLYLVLISLHEPAIPSMEISPPWHNRYVNASWNHTPLSETTNPDYSKVSLADADRTAAIGRSGFTLPTPCAQRPLSSFFL